MISTQLNAGMRLPDGVRWREFDVARIDEIAETWSGEDQKRQIRNQTLLGPSAMLEVDGKIIAGGGIVIYNPGVGEAWTLIDLTRRYDHPLLLTRTFKIALYIGEQSLRLHRVQIAVNSGNIVAVRWAWALGFKIEGLMRKYGSDQSDHYLLARYSNG